MTEKKQNKPLSQQSGLWAAVASIAALVAGWMGAKWSINADALAEAIVALVTLVVSLVTALTAAKVD